MTINERIKAIRKSEHLSQAAFAERLGATRGVIANIEGDLTTPNDAFVNLICRVFNVSLAWLHDGTEPMYVARSANEELAILVNDLMSDADDSFRKRFISLMLMLPSEEWGKLETLVGKLARGEDVFCENSEKDSQNP